jgi:selenoprotein W-related protein
LLKQSLEVDAELLPGSGGIFEVAVNGTVVAAKSASGFPNEAELLEGVGKALGR